MNNLRNMGIRLNYHGGVEQQDRMIKDKRWTLDHAVNYSYQGAKVRDLETGVTAKALINPNKIKQDYDDKIISIGFEHNFTTGTIFEWINTETKWLIYLQDLTELAYFKGDIRRCNYTISWEDENNNVYTTYAAIRGPVETRIDSLARFNTSFDVPNHSLNILLPLTDQIVQYFKRYSKFYLQGLKETDPMKKTCWRVEAQDSISTPGILELTAVEYYSNKFEDDVENGIAGGLIVEPVEVKSLITGEQFIKPKRAYTYVYTGNEESEWKFDSNLPIETKIEGKSITIKWIQTYRGEISLQYGDTKLNIVVESLFG